MYWRIILASGLALGSLSVGGSSPLTGGTAPSLTVAEAVATQLGTQTAFRWPVDDPAIIVRRFDLPAQPWLAGHRGVDLAAPPASPVYAPAAGVVTFVGKVVDRHLIVIDHGALRSTLEPVHATTRLGQAVTAGQQIGAVSDEPAHAPGVVHWGVRRDETYIDPSLLVNPRPRAILLQ